MVDSQLGSNRLQVTSAIEEALKEIGPAFQGANIKLYPALFRLAALVNTSVQSNSHDDRQCHGPWSAAFGTGQRSTWQGDRRPFGDRRLGGLVTSTALNLLVLPTLALRYGRFETGDMDGLE